MGYGKHFLSLETNRRTSSRPSSKGTELDVDIVHITSRFRSLLLDSSIMASRTYGQKEVT